MADDAVYTRTINRRCPLPVDPGVMAIYLSRGAGALDTPVPVPWNNVRLTYAVVITTTAVATADFVIKLELNAASGTLIDTITVAQSGSAIGDIDTVSFVDFTSQAAAKRLNYDDTARDYINVEVGASANAGNVMLYLYFEPESGQ